MYCTLAMSRPRTRLGIVEPRSALNSRETVTSREVQRTIQRTIVRATARRRSSKISARTMIGQSNTARMPIGTRTRFEMTSFNRQK